MSALPSATMAANGTEFFPWRHCDVHTRSTFNILSLCLSTLVICVWNAVHPDVTFPNTPRWKVYLVRFYGFLVGLFLPEVLVLNALCEFLLAREFMQEMNGPEKKLLKEMYPRALTIAYWTEAWRPDVSTESTQPPWTMAQAFYAVLYGFHAKSTSGQLTYLSESEIKDICTADSSKWPFFTGIEDHSKSGALGKALFCWQLLVFIISCIARRTEHLPLSLLEITTLAHSLCGLAAFALWWHKPHSVDEVVVVPIDDSLHGKIAWTKHWTKHSHEEELSTVLGLAMLLDPEHEKLAVLSSLAVAALYGLPHLLGLSVEFPTLVERRCWQVSTAIVIGTLVFVAPLSLIAQKDRARWRVSQIAAILVTGAAIVYPIASCFIVAESFRQLFALPSGAFVAPALVCYLPHFS